MPLVELSRNGFEITKFVSQVAIAHDHIVGGYAVWRRCTPGPAPAWGRGGPRPRSPGDSGRSVRAVDDEDLAGAGPASPSLHQATNSPMVTDSLSAGMTIDSTGASTSPSGTMSEGSSDRERLGDVAGVDGSGNGGGVLACNLLDTVPTLTAPIVRCLYASGQGEPAHDVYGSLSTSAWPVGK